MSFFLSAVIMGFLSGGHCLGMCGPLVLALPVSPGALWISVVYRVIYNAGRITTYGLLGILTGVIGLAFSLQNMQAFLARLAGFFLIVVALVQLAPMLHFPVFSGIHSRLGRALAPLIARAGKGRFFLLGMLNGFLPCGMVAAALMVSVAAETWSRSIWFMLLFGLGTFPLMLAASVFGIYLGGRVRRILSWLGPVYAFALGLLLIARPALIAPHCAR